MSNNSENKRVVFVSLKPSTDDEGNNSNSSSSSLNPRTRRKRALGVDPSTTSFAEFKSQVANRLQLKFGIKAIRHKGSGMLVKSVEDLLDIEDLEVEEFREEEVQANGGYGSTQSMTMTMNKRDESNKNASTSRSIDQNANINNNNNNGKDGDDDAEKYKRRTSMATRQMQKVLPYAYSKKLNPAGAGNNEGLDDSYEDEETLLAAQAGKKKRKNLSGSSSSSGGKKSWFSDPRAIVVTVSLISCLLTMILLYQRVSLLESEIDSARNAGVLKTDGGNTKKESRTRMAIEKIEKAALEAEEAGEMYVPEA